MTNFLSNYESSDLLKNALVLLLLFISAQAANFVTTDEFIAVLTIIFSFIFLIKKKKIDSFILILILIWSLINGLSFLVNQTQFNSYTFFGFIVRFILPYLMIKFIGKSFINRLEKFIFFLTAISLPIFALQLLFPTIFYSLSSTLNLMAGEAQVRAGGWYIGIYMFSGWGPHRNCGFMWESGAFAFMIILAILIRLNKNGVTYDSKILIYILALLSTYSTMGISSLSLIILLFTVKTRNYSILLLILPILVYFYSDIMNLEFFLPEIRQKIALIDTPAERYGYFQLNRIGYFFYALEQLNNWPFGYGIIPSATMPKEFQGRLIGVGSISRIIIFWGIQGIIFLVYAISRFFKSIQLSEDKLLTSFSIIILLMAFFSNPLGRSLILFSIVYYPLLYYKRKNRVSS